MTSMSLDYTLCVVRSFQLYKIVRYWFWDMNWAWLLVFRVRNSGKVWYSHSSEPGSPRRENQKCENGRTRASRSGECISPEREPVRVVWFCLGTSLGRSVLQW